LSQRWGAGGVRVAGGNLNQWGNMTSPSQKIKTKRPINIARKTRIERSLFLMTLISPVKRASTPEVPASSIGMVSARLLKNVSPPRWPEATRSRNVIKNTKKAPMNPVDHLPMGVFGKIVTRMPLLFASVE